MIKINVTIIINIASPANQIIPITNIYKKINGTYNRVLKILFLYNPL